MEDFMYNENRFATIKNNNPEKAHEFLDKATATITREGKIPELYYSHTTDANENNPLGWSESMYVVALNLV